MTSVETFFKRTSEDPALQEELNKVLEAKQGEEAVLAIRDVARDHGFTLSIEETTAAVRAIGEAYVGSQELSDTDLNDVAGGMGPLFWNRVANNLRT